MPPAGSGSGVDVQAVQRAKREIQQLVQEITALAKSDTAPSDFYEALLSRTMTALVAEGGAIWMRGAEDRLHLQYQINLRLAGLDGNDAARSQHNRLLATALGNGEGVLVPPHSGSAGQLSNPTEYLLVIVPIRTDQGVQGVIEIFQRPGARSTAQQGYMRFVTQMCDLAADFLKTRRLRDFTDKETLWEQLEGFTRAAHRSLELRETAYAIANEGRRVVDCDRVSVVTGRDARCKMVAVSGQEAVESRSNTVTLLVALATEVTKTGEPLWYDGATEHLSPQIEDALHAYLDEIPAKSIAVLPLRRPEPEDAGPVVGAILAEHLTERSSDHVQGRVEAVAKHAAMALANALAHRRLAAVPLLRAVDHARSWLESSRRPKTLAGLSLISMMLIALVAIPVELRIEGRGKLQPAVRRNVFAGTDGIVEQVTARHGQSVAADELLVELRNTELEMQVSDLLGRRDATRQELNAIQRDALGQRGLRPDQRNQLSGRIDQLTATLESLQRQFELTRQKQNRLRVHSPIGGRVITWKLRERIAGRPVRQGQMLMTVADPEGPWELEIQVPQDRMGPVAEKTRSGQPPMKVTYILATNPQQQHEGQVEETEATAEVRGAEGNTVLIRVAIDKRDLPELHPGATVTARFQCGRYPLGYVWFYDVIAFIRSKILFRL